MCGRYVIQMDENYQEIINLVEEIERHQANLKTGEIYPTNVVPAITYDEDLGKKVHLYKWGFPNFKNKGVIINARSETVEEKPMFRKAFFNNRCLVPSSGFYEWKEENGNKQKYHIYLKDYPIMHMAGFYNTFKDHSGSLYNAFVILTISANTTMSAIHNRMPVIIESEYSDIWLNNDPNNINNVRSLLNQYGKDMVLNKAG